MFAGYLFFPSSSVECDGIPGLGLETEMDGKYVLNCASHFVTISLFWLLFSTKLQLASNVSVQE